VWNPFQPWLVQLGAYKTYMSTYISYQQSWVHKLKCTFTGDCSVSSSVAYAPSGATKIVLSSAAGIEKGASITITDNTKSSFLETSSTCTHKYTVSEVDGDVITISPATCAEYTKAEVTANGVNASPAPTASALTLSSCVTMEAAGASGDLKLRTSSATKGATDSLVVDFALASDIAPLQELHVTFDLGEDKASTAQKFTPPTTMTIGSADAWGTGKIPCVDQSGADGPCKTAAKGTMSATGIEIVKDGAKNTWKPDGSAGSTADVTFETAVASATLKDVKAGNGGLMAKYKISEGIAATKSGKWFLGAFSELTTNTAQKPLKVTMEFVKGGSASATPTLAKATCTTAF
jgi:hypothetical protein